MGEVSYDINYDGPNIAQVWQSVLYMAVKQSLHQLIYIS